MEALQIEKSYCSYYAVIHNLTFGQRKTDQRKMASKNSIKFLLLSGVLQLFLFSMKDIAPIFSLFANLSFKRNSPINVVIWPGDLDRRHLHHHGIDSTCLFGD